MTAPTINEMVEQQEQRRFAAEAAKRAALKAAGGLASDKTLRDEFAMAAMSAYKAAKSATLMNRAELAYLIADAMLEARKTTGEGEA
jgi:hypothetical protein